MKKRRFSKLPALILATIYFVATGQGCGQVGGKAPASTSTSHQKLNWRAEDYFDGHQEIALCKAIEANDLKSMQQLIEAGANANAKGKGNMTPLLWAFPDEKPERFQLLLKHGADPNVIVESDFNSNNKVIRGGGSVTHLAAKSSFPQHFMDVMEHGGDPNLVDPKTKDTLLSVVIQTGGANRIDRVKKLIEKGADLNKPDALGHPPMIAAASWFAQFDLALLLLEAGADPNVYMENHNSKLVHIVIGKEDTLQQYGPTQRADYDRLVQALKDRGQSFEEARADIARWHSWGSLGRSKAKELRRAEIAARKAKEAANKQDK